MTGFLRNKTVTKKSKEFSNLEEDDSSVTLSKSNENDKNHIEQQQHIKEVKDDLGNDKIANEKVLNSDKKNDIKVNPMQKIRGLSLRGAGDILSRKIGK